MSRKVFCETLFVAATLFVVELPDKGTRQGVIEARHYIHTELQLRAGNRANTGFTETEEKILKKLSEES